MTWRGGAPMHKELHLLGLLLSGPKTGYQLHRIVVAHGELYADLKKGNVYYLLERLEQAGALSVTTEAGARGPRRERLIYALTDLGRQRFHELLREVVRTYEVAHSGVEVGMIFLSSLEPQEAISLMHERRQVVLARRSLIEGQARQGDHPHMNLAQDHLMTMVNAELAWTDRALRQLQTGQDTTPAALAASSTDIAPRCPGSPGDPPATDGPT